MNALWWIVGSAFLISLTAWIGVLTLFIGALLDRVLLVSVALAAVALVIGYVDKESPVGTWYQKTKTENPFYRVATFVSTEELVDALENAGFSEFDFVQTIYHRPEEIDGLEPVEAGYGEGSFIGLRATR